MYVQNNNGSKAFGVAVGYITVILTQTSVIYSI